MQAFAGFFNSDNFMPHGHCFLWQPDIFWLHLLSDSAIVAAYYAIPLVLIFFVRKRKDIPFETVFWLFGAFILLCGTTHLMAIWTLWNPDYGAEGIIKAMTGIVSLATLAVTVKLMPRALMLASPTQLAQLNAELQHNIDERDLAQKNLQYAYSVVEKQVEERTAELNKSLQELSRSNAELDEFAHIASHDLKEPLRGLSNHAAFLLEDYRDKLDTDGVHRLERLTFLSRRMEQLVGDLLYFSQLGRGDLAVQETDPNEIVLDIEQLMESFLKERNARIVVPRQMPRAVQDKPRITEVFRNLITNAVKYNDKDERLVEIGFLNRLDTPHGLEIIVYYVKDNGIGIAPEFHEDIFHIFKRLRHSSGEEEPGTGAGLTFVKKIVERNRGKIWLESEPGTGTTFYFTLEEQRHGAKSAA